MGRKRIDGDLLKKYNPKVKRNFSVRVPKDLDKQLFQYVMDNDLNMSEVIVAMMRLFLNGDNVGIPSIVSFKDGQKGADKVIRNIDNLFQDSVILSHINNLYHGEPSTFKDSLFVNIRWMRDSIIRSIEHESKE